MKKNLLLFFSLLCFSLSKAQTGSALNFDGVNDYCARPTLISSQNTNLTLETRANWTGTTTANQFLAFNGHTGTNGYGLMVLAYQNSLTVIYGASLTVPITTITPGVWNLYSLVLGNNTFTLYINGVSTYTYNTGFNPYTPTTGSFAIGATQSGFENFNGTIDDVRLWNRQMCASEVSFRANCQLLGNEPGLVANYKFNQGTAAGSNATVTTLIDSSPNANNATLTNFALTGASSNWINPVGVFSTTCSSPAPITASISPSSNPTICIGSAATLSVSGGINTYTWSNSATSVSISTSPTVTTTYSVIGSNTTTGCYGMATKTIAVNPTPTISVNSGSICSGQSFTIVPSGANTYTIQGGSAVVSPTANSSYTVIGTSTAGCVSSNTAVSSVSVNALPTVSVNSGAICAGNSFTINASGTANTYSYSGGSSVVSPTANANYTVTGTNTITSCANTAVSSVSVNALPTVSVNNGTICAGNSFTIVPSGASTYTISGGLSVVTPTSNTSYNVIGTSSAGCVSSNTAVSSVTVNALPTVSVNSGAICVGNSFTINASGTANTYSYSGGSSVVSPTANANYTVTGTNTITSCANTAVSSVSVNTLPTVSAVSNTSLLCTGQTASLTASGAATYTWNTSANTSVIAISPTVNTTYTVNGTGANGCSNFATVTQSVSACTGIKMVAEALEATINVYPNPSNGVFSIEVSTGSTSNITVVDVLGNVVYNQQIKDGIHLVNLSNLNNGLYVLKTESNGAVKTVRLIKE
ncbi:MAG: LamG-like jellyroll fold domain-containing protein [Bacteroidota bacterium]|nr:LamG-like jellyroll fold domain-containing protein [Bacteroidota bacterium]